MLYYSDFQNGQISSIPHVHLNCGVSLHTLKSGDLIQQHRSVLTLVQVMACCLAASSHYLSQYWLLTKGFSGIHLRSDSQEVLQTSIHKLSLKRTFGKLISLFLRDNEGTTDPSINRTTMKTLSAVATMMALPHTVHMATLNMYKKGLTTVPANAGNYTTMILANNRITELPAGAFTSVLDLIAELYLWSNLIRYINDHAFDGCYNLWKIELGRNQLVTLPSNFGPNLGKLQYLKVDSNNDLDMPQIYFSRFTGLKTLHVSGTKIIIYDMANYPKMEMLQVMQHFVPNVSGHNKLKEIRILYLPLSHVPDGNMSSLRRLSEVDYYGGLMVTCPTVGEGLPLLKTINIMNTTRMTSIPDLTHLPKLTTVSGRHKGAFKLRCDPSFCWFLMEQHNIEFIYIKCRNPPELRGREPQEETIDPLELKCYEGEVSYKICMQLLFCLGAVTSTFIADTCEIVFFSWYVASRILWWSSVLVK